MAPVAAGGCSGGPRLSGPEPAGGCAGTTGSGAIAAEATVGARTADGASDGGSAGASAAVATMAVALDISDWTTEVWWIWLWARFRPEAGGIAAGCSVTVGGTKENDAVEIAASEPAPGGPFWAAMSEGEGSAAACKEATAARGGGATAGEGSGSGRSAAPGSRRLRRRPVRRRPSRGWGGAATGRGLTGARGRWFAARGTNTGRG